jgi:hypothetical protein
MRLILERYAVTLGYTAVLAVGEILALALGW